MADSSSHIESVLIGPEAQPLPARPTGTITFLFTDIEGSTKRWERDPQSMGEALSRHHALVRTAIEAHDGYVFTIVGDEFCTAFASAHAACLAARDAQLALRAESWKNVEPLQVRMAIHTGGVEVQGGNYASGPALNRVARLLSVLVCDVGSGSTDSLGIRLELRSGA